MARRSTKNETGIDRLTIENGNAHDAWAAFICVNCHALNYVRIGDHLLTPEDAYDTQSWECSECGFVHSKDSDLPDSWSNWKSELLEKEELTVQRFWQAFFRSSTENPEAYWKQCNVCGRILPNNASSR